MPDVWHSGWKTLQEFFFLAKGCNITKVLFCSDVSTLEAYSQFSFVFQPKGAGTRSGSTLCGNKHFQVSIAHLLGVMGPYTGEQRSWFCIHTSLLLDHLGFDHHVKDTEWQNFMIALQCRQRYPQLILTILGTSSYGTVSTRNRGSPASPWHKASSLSWEMARAWKSVHESILWSAYGGYAFVIFGCCSENFIMAVAAASHCYIWC